MSNGKGSKPRPVNGAKYRANFDAIFRKPTKPKANNLRRANTASNHP